MSTKLRNLIEKTVKSKEEQLYLDRQTVAFIASENIPVENISELVLASERIANNQEFVIEANKLLNQKDDLMERKLLKLSEDIVRHSQSDEKHHSETSKELSLLYFASVK